MPGLSRIGASLLLGALLTELAVGDSTRPAPGSCPAAGDLLGAWSGSMAHEGEEEAFPMELLYGIAGAVVALVILAIIVFLILKKKKEEKEREEEEEEEDDDFGISLHYDPKGKVAKGGKHVESSVPLAPGMINGNEAEMRKRGSNIIEITLPTKEEMEKEEEIPDYREDEMEEEIEDYDEDEMEELSPEEMAAELYGSPSEE